MPEQWKDGLEPRVADQVDYISEQFDGAGHEVGLVTADGGVGFMYAEGQLLVRSDYLNPVRDLLEGYFEFTRIEPVVPGVVLLFLEPRRTDSTPADEPSSPIVKSSGVIVPRPTKHRPLTIIEALELVDEAFGEGTATPNHVLTVAPVSPCPATEPQEVYDGIEPDPGVCKKNSGAGVHVYVADTGLVKATVASLPWLRGVRRAAKPDGQDQDWEQDSVPYQGQNVIPPYAGHGTFVAGVVRCMAPHVDVTVSNAFNLAGSALESDFVRELKQALTTGVDIFHLSVTTPTRRDLPLLAFEGWLALLRQYKGVVCVVAAGNSGSRQPFWPAAFAEVVSVGALAADKRDRARFSNWGGWVDVYAPGRGLINAYTTGTYICRDLPYVGQTREFYGMARWSGTSFSTPIVTGLIAARMWRTGENGKQAAAALLALARCQAIPGVGPVLVPCSGSRGPGACCREGCDCSCHRESCDCGCRRPGAC